MVWGVVWVNRLNVLKGYDIGMCLCDYWGGSCLWGCVCIFGVVWCVGLVVGVGLLGLVFCFVIVFVLISWGVVGVLGGVLWFG